MGSPVNDGDSLGPELKWDEASAKGLNDGWLDGCAHATTAAAAANTNATINAVFAQPLA